MPNSRVIRRLGHGVSDAGVITYHEREATWAEADAVAGRRVDRRRLYCIMTDDDGRDALHEVLRWTQHCTGCTEVPEMTLPPDRGPGCRECGYQGRVRNSVWIASDQGGADDAG
ncbi:hypothetical protein ACFFMP_08615 [Pseudoroseomonas cervicalis]|uniref:hypothetical protein n=1 Tax=Teichococcus cervicalis TaxID=204525 RepID=UPI0035EE8C68